MNKEEYDDFDHLDQLGAVIDTIRKAKSIPVMKLIDNTNVISTSQYYRFAKDATKTSIVRFYRLLDRLNIPIEEFEFIRKLQSTSEFDKLSKKILQVFYGQLSPQEKIKQLTSLDNRAQSLFIKSDLVKFKHLKIISDLLISRLSPDGQNDTVTAEITEVTQYLLQLTHWTHYDITLFNNVMFAIPNDARKTLLASALKNESTFAQYNKLVSEQFTLVMNSLILSLSANHIQQVLDEIKQLHTIVLEPSWTQEHFILYFCDGLRAHLEGEDKTLIQCKDALQFAQKIQAANLIAFFQQVMTILGTLKA